LECKEVSELMKGHVEEVRRRSVRWRKVRRVWVMVMVMGVGGMVSE
jgi:hypothetical protein